MRAVFASSRHRISFPWKCGSPRRRRVAVPGYGRESAYVVVRLPGLPVAGVFRGPGGDLHRCGGTAPMGKMHTRTLSYLDKVYPRCATLSKCASGRSAPALHQRLSRPVWGIVSAQRSVCGLLCLCSACQLDRRSAIRSAVSQPWPGLATPHKREKTGQCPQPRPGRAPLGVSGWHDRGVHRAPLQACLRTCRVRYWLEGPGPTRL